MTYSRWLSVLVLFAACADPAADKDGDSGPVNMMGGTGGGAKADDDSNDDEPMRGDEGGDLAGTGGNEDTGPGPLGGSGGAAAEKPDAAAGKPADASAILGTGDHTAGSVKITKMSTAAGCLQKPTDIAFNPRRPAEFWVVNYGDNSVCIVFDVREATIRSERRRESSHEHFMPRPMSLAFGGDKTTFGIPGTFATANDSAGDSNPDDGQMWNGITLWSSDLNVFGKFKGPDGNSHLDMLHDSPLARGIAWEKDNFYWVFGAMLQDITRYDFANDHERGNADHSDGSQWHYAIGKVKGVNGVPSHMVYDPGSKMLYIADTGNGRVARLNTAAGTMNPKRHTRLRDRPETRVDAVMDGVEINDLVPAGGELKQPSGIELFEGVLFVSDHATGHIHAFDLDGKRLNWIDTGVGASQLGGIAVGPDRKIYFVAMSSNTVYSLAP